VDGGVGLVVVIPKMRGLEGVGSFLSQGDRRRGVFDPSPLLFRESKMRFKFCRLFVMGDS
jgi:hypothetical protein